MSELDLLDETCHKIFMYLGLINKKMGFNSLYRSLEKMGNKISKPTLSLHLKHLTEKKILTRKESGKQKVFYEVNWNSFSQVLEARAIGNKLSNYFLLGGEYQYLSPEKELTLAEFTSEYLIFQQLRFSILAVLNPEKMFDYNLALLLISRQFDIYRSILVDGCRKNKEFGEQVLKLLEARIAKDEKIIHENIDDDSSDIHHE